MGIGNPALGSLLALSTMFHLVAPPAGAAPAAEDGHHPEGLLEGPLARRVEVLEPVQRRLGEVLAPHGVDLFLHELRGQSGKFN